jgi:hypothetical protein
MDQEKSMSGSARRPLECGETGTYAEMILRPLPDGMLLVFVPSLAALLTRAEQLKGAEVTCEEVFRIRDNCNVVVTPAGAARAMEEKRGYADLDINDPWNDWLRLQGRFE